MSAFVSGGNTVHVNTIGLDEVVGEFDATVEQIRVAGRRAVNKTLKWVWTQAKRDIAGHVGVAQRMLGRRFQVRDARQLASGVVSGSAWIGLNPIGVTRELFGSMSRTPAGARAGRRVFPGAFVFLTPKRGPAGVYKRRGRKRTPIDLVKIEVDDDETRSIINGLAAGAADRLAELMRQELNYEVNVR